MREDAPFVVRQGTDEIVVTAPGGKVSFLSFWDFVRFAWQAAKAGVRIEVKDR